MSKYFLKTNQQKNVYAYLKENVGWLCPEIEVDRGSCCPVNCWLHEFFRLYQRIFKSHFLTPRKKKPLFEGFLKDVKK